MPHKDARYYFANREKYIEIIAGWSWKKTERQIAIIRQQYKWALQQRNDEAFMVLQEWENQAVEARMRKLDAEEIKVVA